MSDIVLLGRSDFLKNKIFSLFYNDDIIYSDDLFGNIKCSYSFKGKFFNIINFPKIFSLVSFDESSNLSKNLCKLLMDNNVSLILNVVDFKDLNNDLYLTVQILEQFNVPVILLVVNSNCSDNDNYIFDKLSDFLSCDLLLFDFSDKNFLFLKNYIFDFLSFKIKNLSYKNYSFFFKTSYVDSFLKKMILNVISNINVFFDCNLSFGILIRILEGDSFFRRKFDFLNIVFIKKFFFNLTGCQIDVYIAQSRHSFIARLLELLKSKKDISRVTLFLDNILLNRVLALPVFFFIVYIMFVFAVDIGSFFKDFFDFFGQSILVEGCKEFLIFHEFSYWFVYFVSEGFFCGFVMVLSFIPILVCMFGFLSILEFSGYVPRTVFVIDKLMRVIGLPSKSFVPMIIGFGCNVPAILSTRGFDNKGEKILTIIMTPFVSCNARLAIYIVFVSVFYGQGGGDVIFFLYLIGILVAIFTGLIFKFFFLKDESQFIVNFPCYKFPQFNLIFNYVFYNLKSFLLKAGSIIIPVSIFISMLGMLSKDFNFAFFDSYFKKSVVVFHPMGIKNDNWPAVVALASGVIAKEVIIGTLDALYRNEMSLSSKFESKDVTNLSLLVKFYSNLSYNFFSIDSSVFVSMDLYNFSLVDKDISKIMYKKFGGPIEAFSYLLFILLYFPCVSVVATIYKELNGYWAIFSIIWCTFISYSVSVFFYQVVTFSDHIIYSLNCIFLLFFVFLFLFFCFRFYFYKFIYV